MRDGLTLGLAVGTSGLAFGAAAVSSGLSVAQTCALSLLAYTGASQFALAGAVAAAALTSPAPKRAELPPLGPSGVAVDSSRAMICATVGCGPSTPLAMTSAAVALTWAAAIDVPM